MLIKPPKRYQISLPSLKSAGIKPSPWLHIVHIKPELLDTWSNLTFWLSGLWGYQDIGFERFVITLGIMVLLAIPADLWDNSLMDTNQS